MSDPADFGKLQIELLYRLVQEATQDSTANATVSGQSLDEYGTDAESRHSAAASVQAKLNQRDRNTIFNWTVSYEVDQDEFRVRRSG